MKLATGKLNYTILEQVSRDGIGENLRKYHKFGAACRPQMTFLCEERVFEVRLDCRGCQIRF